MACAAPFSTFELVRLDETLWEIPAGSRPGMRVPARIFADADLLDAIADGWSLEQLANIATLPGVVGAALAMPDIHQGYGFPVGGVAATALPDGVVSPGGVGYDMNCGVRPLVLPLAEAECGRRREVLVHQLSRAIPAGPGSPFVSRVSCRSASSRVDRAAAAARRNRAVEGDAGGVEDRVPDRGGTPSVGISDRRPGSEWAGRLRSVETPGGPNRRAPRCQEARFRRPWI